MASGQCFPATFNPPTLAHGEMARWALQEGQCRGVLLLIDLRHADKEAPEAHLLDRLMMAKLAFPPEEGFSLGISSHGRFLDKALALEALFGEKRSWCFIVGSDASGGSFSLSFTQIPERSSRPCFRWLHSLSSEGLTR
jgi:nicotinic acid mononucleotide adenylyltransferase